MTEHVKECPRCGYTGVHNCGCLVTEHVHKWELVQCEDSYGTKWVVGECKNTECGSQLHESIVIEHLNEYETLRKENEALKEWLGEDGLIEMAVAQLSPDEVADILEGKDE